MYRAPWRDDDDHASFAVYKDGWRDFGGAFEHGDVFDFLQRHFGWTFAQAQSYVENYCGTAPLLKVSPSPVRPAQADPPSAQWQSAASRLLDACVRYLHSNRPDARRAYDYLKHQRGLSDETIRRARLGYNPRWQSLDWKTPEGTPARLAPGIVIPVEAGGALWALRVRCRVGNLAEALGIPDDTHTSGQPFAKYRSATGSKLSGSLFNADSLSPSRPALFVEGEFDALLAAQILGDSVSVVSLGSVANPLAARWHSRLPSAVYLALDADAPGQQAAQQLAADLGSHAHRLSLPQGKDITDFVVTHHGDLKDWFCLSPAVFAPPLHCVERELGGEVLLPQPSTPTPSPWFPDGVPDSWRTALLNYFPTGAALIFELLNDALLAGCLDPDDFTVPEVKQASRDLGYNIPPSTIDRLLTATRDLLFSKIESSFKDNTESPTKSKRSGGAPAARYALLNLNLVKTHLMTWAEPRIREKLTPTGKDGTLVQFEQTMLEPIAVDETEPEPLNEALSETWEQQPEPKKYAGKRAVSRKSKLKKALKNRHSTPLPAGWPRARHAEYQKAFAHVVIAERQSEQFSRQAIHNLFGVSMAAVGSFMKAAGFEAVPHYYEAAVLLKDDIAAQLHAHRIECQGYPLAVIITAPGGSVSYHRCGTPETEKLIGECLASGYSVRVRYQEANSYCLVSDTPLPKPPPPPITGEMETNMPPDAPLDDPDLPSEDDMTDEELDALLDEDEIAQFEEDLRTEFEPESRRPKDLRERRRKRKKQFRGPGYDPAWVLGQLRLGLRLAGGWIERDDESMLNPQTGEVIAGDNAKALIAAILALKKASDSPPDNAPDGD